MKIDFTREQLFEIEKVFDVMACQILKRSLDIILALGKVKNNKKKQTFFNKLLDEQITAYDLCRTISAICDGKKIKGEGK